MSNYMLFDIDFGKNASREIKGEHIVTPPLSEDEIVIWQTWLPDVCTEKLPQYSLRAWKRKGLPLPVRKRWDQWIRKCFFDTYEIWSQSKAGPEHFLVGVIDDKKYALARWDESEEDLLFYVEVKQELVRRWKNKQNFDASSLKIVIFYWLAIVSFWVGAIKLDREYEIGLFTTISIYVIFVCHFILSVLIYLYFKKRLYEVAFGINQCMQAIRRNGGGR